MKIELTHDQEQAIRHGQMVEIRDPQTQQLYLLIAREAYERGGGPPAQQPPPKAATEDSDIPPGILRSQRAFWRDLPALLAHKQLRGQWVCYHGDERVGIAPSDEPLIRECLRRRIPDDAYHLDVIEVQTRPPWEPLDIESGGHEADEMDLADGPRPAGKPV